MMATSMTQEFRNYLEFPSKQAPISSNATLSIACAKSVTLPDPLLYILSKARAKSVTLPDPLLDNGNKPFNATISIARDKSVTLPDPLLYNATISIARAKSVTIPDPLPYNNSHWSSTEQALIMSNVTPNGNKPLSTMAKDYRNTVQSSRIFSRSCRRKTQSNLQKSAEFRRNSDTRISECFSQQHNPIQLKQTASTNCKPREPWPPPCMPKAPWPSPCHAHASGLEPSPHCKCLGNDSDLMLTISPPQMHGTFEKSFPCRNNPNAQYMPAPEWSRLRGHCGSNSAPTGGISMSFFTQAPQAMDKKPILQGICVQGVSPFQLTREERKCIPSPSPDDFLYSAALVIIGSAHSTNPHATVSPQAVVLCKLYDINSGASSFNPPHDFYKYHPPEAVSCLYYCNCFFAGVASSKSNTQQRQAAKSGRAPSLLDNTRAQLLAAGSVAGQNARFDNAILFTQISYAMYCQQCRDNPEEHPTWNSLDEVHRFILENACLYEVIATCMINGQDKPHAPGPDHLYTLQRFTHLSFVTCLVVYFQKYKGSTGARISLWKPPSSVRSKPGPHTGGSAIPYVETALSEFRFKDLVSFEQVATQFPQFCTARAMQYLMAFVLKIDLSFPEHFKTTCVVHEHQETSPTSQPSLERQLRIILAEAEEQGQTTDSYCPYGPIQEVIQDPSESMEPQAISVISSDDSSDDESFKAQTGGGRAVPSWTSAQIALHALHKKERTEDIEEMPVDISTIVDSQTQPEQEQDKITEKPEALPSTGQNLPKPTLGPSITEKVMKKPQAPSTIVAYQTQPEHTLGPSIPEKVMKKSEAPSTIVAYQVTMREPWPHACALNASGLEPYPTLECLGNDSNLMLTTLPLQIPPEHTPGSDIQDKDMGKYAEAYTTGQNLSEHNPELSIPEDRFIEKPRAHSKLTAEAMIAALSGDPAKDLASFAESYLPATYNPLKKKLAVQSNSEKIHVPSPDSRRTQPPPVTTLNQNLEAEYRLLQSLRETMAIVSHFEPDSTETADLQRRIQQVQSNIHNLLQDVTAAFTTPQPTASNSASVRERAGTLGPTVNVLRFGSTTDALSQNQSMKAAQYPLHQPGSLTPQSQDSLQVPLHDLQLDGSTSVTQKPLFESPCFNDPKTALPIIHEALPNDGGRTQPLEAQRLEVPPPHSNVLPQTNYVNQATGQKLQNHTAPPIGTLPCDMATSAPNQGKSELASTTKLEIIDLTPSEEAYEAQAQGAGRTQQPEAQVGLSESEQLLPLPAASQQTGDHVDLFGSKSIITEELPSYDAYANNVGPVTLRMIMESTENLGETRMSRLSRSAILTNFGSNTKETLTTCYTGDFLTALHVCKAPQALFFDLHAAGAQLIQQLAPDKCKTCNHLLLSTKDPAVRNMLQWPVSPTSTDPPTVHSINRTIIEVCPGAAYCPICVVITGDVFAVTGFPKLETFLMSTETTKRALFRPIESDALNYLALLISQEKLPNMEEILARCKHSVCPMTMMPALAQQLPVHECPIAFTDMFMAREHHQHPAAWNILAKKHLNERHKKERHPEDDNHKGKTDPRTSTRARDDRDSRNEVRSISHDTDSDRGKGKGGMTHPRDTENSQSKGKGGKSRTNRDPYHNPRPYNNSGYDSGIYPATHVHPNPYNPANHGHNDWTARQQDSTYGSQPRPESNNSRKRRSDYQDQQDPSNYSALAHLHRDGNSKDRRLDPN